MGVQDFLNRNILIKRINKILTKKIVILILVLMTVTNMLYKTVIYPQVYHNTCDAMQSQQLIVQMCDEFRLEEAGGSLCRSLCQDKLLEYEMCVNYRFGKTVAYMRQQFEDQSHHRIVLKVEKSTNLNKVFMEQFFSKIKTKESPIDVMAAYIRKHVKREFDFVFKLTNTDLLSYMWGYNVSAYIESAHNKTAALSSALRSIYFLMQQREYVFTKIHEKHAFSPKIIGTCGAVYFLEFTPSIAERKSGLYQGRGLSIHLTSWTSRAILALKLLELLKTLETTLHEPLQLCDVKSQNFGVRKGPNDIVLIDTDQDKFDKVFEWDLEDRHCEVDEHCSRNTCPGVCNKARNTCAPIRTNNNLQSLCDRVFLDKYGPIATGLLRGAPWSIQRELSALVNQCAYGSGGSTSSIALDLEDKTIINITTTENHSEFPDDSIRLKLLDVIKRGITG